MPGAQHIPCCLLSENVRDQSKEAEVRTIKLYDSRDDLCLIALIPSNGRLLCRDLRVMDSPSFLLCVAGAKVESLIHGVYSWEPVNVPKLASMTALTRLRLLDFTFNPSADMRPLQELNLIELALLGCLGVTAALFKPGAFRALQTLNVEEDFDNLLDADGEVIDFPQQPSSQLVSHYHQLGRAVFGLPSLIELSGENRFSSLEVPEKHLLGWQKCISSNGPSVDGVHEVWRRVPSVW